MARNLTDKQKMFLEALFMPGIDGNAHKAKQAAGYSDNVATSQVVAGLKEEILSATKDYLISRGPKAAISMANVLDDPTELGVRDKMTAAKDILDRIGVVKVDKVEVSGQGLFILPAKQEE